MHRFPSPASEVPQAVAKVEGYGIDPHVVDSSIRVINECVFCRGKHGLCLFSPSPHSSPYRKCSRSGAVCTEIWPRQADVSLAKMQCECSMSLPTNRRLLSLGPEWALKPTEEHLVAGSLPPRLAPNTTCPEICPTCARKQNRRVALGLGCDRSICPRRGTDSTHERSRHVSGKPRFKLLPAKETAPLVDCLDCFPLGGY